VGAPGKAQRWPRQPINQRTWSSTAATADPTPGAGSPWVTTEPSISLSALSCSAPALDAMRLEKSTGSAALLRNTDI
jgi:hypothetical protein